MKRLLRTPVVIASLIVNLAATVVFAQSEKISPRIAPKPNAGSSPTGMPPMTIKGSMKDTFTGRN
jgi:hypothetical protein